MVNESKGFTGIQMIDAGAADAVPATKPVSAFPTIAQVAEPSLQPAEPAAVEAGEFGGGVSKIVIAAPA